MKNYPRILLGVVIMTFLTVFITACGGGGGGSADGDGGGGDNVASEIVGSWQVIDDSNYYRVPSWETITIFNNGEIEAVEEGDLRTYYGDYTYENDYLTYNFNKVCIENYCDEFSYTIESERVSVEISDDIMVWTRVEIDPDETITFKRI